MILSACITAVTNHSISLSRKLLIKSVKSNYFVNNFTNLLKFSRSYKLQLFVNYSMSVETKKLKTDCLQIGTHSGNFHCDEILACFMLQQLDTYKNAEIVRTRNYDLLKTCDIVVDVGEIFNPKENRFDHHQKTFNETLSSLRPELGKEYNIRLSSAGLVYTYFGEEVIKTVLKNNDIILPNKSLSIIYKKVYENFVKEIDAIDNGVQICDGEPQYQISTHLSARVSHFNPSWNSDGSVNENEQFEKAKDYVGKEFLDKILYYTTSWLPARDIVEEALRNASKVHPSGEIIELSSPCPWKEHLFDLEEENCGKVLVKYVLMQDKKDDWRVICVPRKPGSFICRKFLHKDWRGLRSEKITELCGIKDATFCHVTGFIGGAKSRDGALEMAVQSLNGDYID